MFFFLEIIVFLCFSLTYSGTIIPSGSLPISNSIANCAQNADYTFYFIPETSIPAGGQLYITFPNQYLLTSFSSSPSCSVPCSLSSRTVILTFPSEVYNGTVANVTIYQVKNPLSSGGTGMFILKSYTGQNLLDENEIFGAIGIASSVNLLTNSMTSLKSGGVSTAGAFTTYLITFRTASYIPWNSYIKIIIPIASGFVLTKFPACSSYPIYNQILPGVLHCETVGSNIIITGFNDNIAAKTDCGILIPMQNPGYATTTDVFKVAIYRGGTQLIYDWINDIPGVTITAGSLSGISLTKINPYAIQSMNKIMDYELRFTLANALTSSSVISIIFPATFVLAVSPIYQYFAINYGLEDIGEYSTVAMTYANNQLLISNFQPTSPNTKISLTLRCSNPNAAGYTTPLKLVTYTDSSQTTIIDQDLTSAKTTIASYTSTKSLTMAGITPNPTPALANGAYIDLTFTINPAVTIPPSGFIKVRIPDAFQVRAPFAPSPPVCYLAAGTGSPAQSCWASGNVITIGATTAMTYTAGTAGQFRIVGQVKTPIYNSTFLFDIETYDVDGVRLLESYTDYLIVQANTLVSYSLNLFGNSNQNSILDFSLTTIQAMPDGGPQYKAMDTQGRIELIFLTTGWATDLGTGYNNGDYLTCKAISGIVGINGQEITCQLMIATLPRITIKNFQSIAANTPIRFQVIYVVPPTGTNTHTVKLSLISLQNRICSNLNEIIISTSTNNVAGPTPSSSTLTLSPTTWQVNSYFDVTFYPNFASIPANSYILVTLPSYDTKFIQLSSIISCSVQATSTSTFISIPCIPYYGVDWIMMQTPILLTNTALLKITNLLWPRYVKALTATFCFQTSTFSSTNLNYIGMPGGCGISAIGTPTAGGFDLAMISVPKKGIGYVDCSYTFTFQISNKIPANSQLILTFPSTYSLIDSTPAPSFSAPLLSGYSGSLQFSTTTFTLTISNIGEYPENTKFQILATGIKNPSFGTTSSGWNIDLFFSGALVNSQQNFFSFPFGPQFSTGFVIINQISAFPINADEYADYTIVFTPQTDIPIAGLITVTFPGNQYKELPGNLNCILTGGIETFTSCILSATTVKITTGQRYSAGVGSIYLKIRNIKNPDAGTTDGFTVTTSYDGVTLDVTDTSSLNGRTFTSIPKAQNVYVSTLSFDPQNEGEESTYNFTFVTSNMIDSANHIVIIFPDDYSPSIGRLIQCVTYSGLIGDISCSVSNRGIYITNFETYLPSADKPVGILVYGVINPNKNDAGATGMFKIGTQILSTAKFLDYNSAVGTITVLAAPGWATLYNVTSVNVYSRLTSDYTFDFNAARNIPKTSSYGKVYVDFPTQFSIPDSDLTCSTPTSDFAAMISCSISRNRVSINGQTSDYTGEINMTISGILNPTDSGKCDNINVRTYDGMNKKIIERSFENLDPFNFNYVYPGPLIIVNGGNDISVDRGTQSPDLYFTFDYPSRLNITIKPILPGFSLIPYENDISVGMLIKKFRVSVPINFYDGDYYLYWTTLNDLTPYYTPLKQTKVTVTKNGGNLLAIQPILDVPFGGQSLMTFITTPNSPDIGITIKVNFLTQYKGLTLDKNSIDWIPGMNSVNFTILSSTDPNALGISAQKGTLSFILDGVNKDIFSLPSSTIDFLMIASDTIAPLLKSFSIYNTSQTNVYIAISVNEPVHLFYMLALNGTLPPPLSEIKSNGPAPWNTTLSTYGFYVVRDSSTTPFVFKIDGLTANRDYVIYAYLEDRGRNVNSQPYNLSFTTADIYAVADFSIQLNQPSSDSYDIKGICDSLAFVLSLNQDRVQERKYVLTATTRRMLDSVTSVTVVSTTLNLQILPMPDNQYFPAPTLLVASLANKTSELGARIPNFDTTYSIPYSEVARYKPKFIGNAILSNFSFDFASFSFSLNNYGWVYIVAIRQAEDLAGYYPTAFQISLGYNQSNIPLDAYGFIEVNQSYTTFNITLSELDSSTYYNAYIAAGSANPGYPDLMEYKYVQMITFYTYIAPPIERLDINGLKRTFTIILEMVGLIALVIFGF